MNPLMIGILAVGGIMVFANMAKGGYNNQSLNGPERRISNITIEVPSAGFRGGGVSGTVADEYLPPMAGGY